jgi:hypothetical protein
MNLVALCALVLLAVASPSIAVEGAFVKPQTLDGASIAALTHVSLVVDEEHGDSHVTYAGVPVAALLASAGAPVGSKVKGAPARSYVIVHAADGYAAVFTLAELETSDASCAPVLADRRNGGAIGADAGPFRMLAPCDKTQARWVREVTGFTIVTVPDTKAGGPA